MVYAVSEYCVTFNILLENITLWPRVYYYFYFQSDCGVNQWKVCTCNSFFAIKAFGTSNLGYTPALDAHAFLITFCLSIKNSKGHHVLSIN